MRCCEMLADSFTVQLASIDDAFVGPGACVQLSPVAATGKVVSMTTPAEQLAEVVTFPALSTVFTR